MRSVELLRAERGAKKVSCTKVLQVRCELSLTMAKAATDAMLAGDQPRLALRTDDDARSLIAELASLGVAARFAEVDGYDPQEELAKAIQPLHALLPIEARRTIESLAGHGEWELALSHCAAVLAHSPGTVPPDVCERLDQLAFEFGVVANKLGRLRKAG